jgi:hypothetical protein
MEKQEIINLLKGYSNKGEKFDPENGMDVKEVWEKVEPKYPDYELHLWFSQYAGKFQATIKRKEFGGNKPIWFDSFHPTNPYIAVCESIIKIEELA